MAVWEAFWKADQEANLADSVTGKAWVSAQPWGRSCHCERWPPETDALWTRNVLAFRSLVSRLKGKRPRRRQGQAAMKAFAADQLLYYYVNGLRVVLKDRLPEDGPLAADDASYVPLSAKTYRGLDISTNVLAPERVKGQAGAWQQPDAETLGAALFEDFWQSLFYGLLAEQDIA